MKKRHGKAVIGGRDPQYEDRPRTTTAKFVHMAFEWLQIVFFLLVLYQVVQGASPAAWMAAGGRLA